MLGGSTILGYPVFWPSRLYSATLLAIQAIRCAKRRVYDAQTKAIIRGRGHHTKPSLNNMEVCKEDQVPQSISQVFTTCGVESKDVAGAKPTGTDCSYIKSDFDTALQHQDLQCCKALTPIALEVRTVGAGGFGSSTSVDCTPGVSHASEIEDGTGSSLGTDMSFNNNGFGRRPLSWMATMPDAQFGDCSWDVHRELPVSVGLYKITCLKKVHKYMLMFRFFKLSHHVYSRHHTAPIVVFRILLKTPVAVSFASQSPDMDYRNRSITPSE